MVIRNHFFWVAQNRKFVSDWLEKPNIEGKILVQNIHQCEHSLGTLLPSG